MTSHPVCPICAARLRLYAERPISVYAGPLLYNVYRCDGCRCGVTIPTPTPAVTALLYEKAYDYDTHTLIESEKRWRARRILSHLSGEPLSSLLDVGCMSGYLLQEARKQGVVRAEGVELSETAVRWARQQGVTVFQGTLEQYAATRPGVFDLVVAQHVLEHILDLHGFLRAAFALLRPGGRLVLCVPHFGSRTQRCFRRSWGWYQLPAHLFHFSPAALRILVQRYGTELKLTFRGGESLFVLLTLLYSLGRLPRRAPKPTPFKKAAMSLASLALRHYYYLGDEEILAVFRNQGTQERRAGALP